MIFYMLACLVQIECSDSTGNTFVVSGAEVLKKINNIR